MWKRFPLRLALLILTVPAVSPLIPRAQSQDSSSPSVAEAARRARQQKKKSDKPAVVVVDDDTLKHAPPASTATSAPAGNQAGTSAMANPSDSSAPAEQAAAPMSPSKLADKLNALKQQLVEAQKNLELAQIDLSLQQDTYFSNPDYVHDKDGKAKLDAKQLDVTEKQRIVDELKVKIAELESQNPSTTSAPSQP